MRAKKGRSLSSNLWLDRQARDPFVAQAKKRGYRSRAAFKLEALDAKAKLLRPGHRVVDLGAAPGGWSQIAAQKVGEKGRVVAVDIQKMQGLPGVVDLQLDIYAPDTPDLVCESLGGKADVVLSDMAPQATGHGATDHLRSMALAEAALDVAKAILKPGGAFVAKVLQGGQEGDLEKTLRAAFQTVKREKPPASRQDSREFYFVATGFRPG